MIHQTYQVLSLTGCAGWISPCYQTRPRPLLSHNLLFLSKLQAFLRIRGQPLCIVKTALYRAVSVEYLIRFKASEPGLMSCIHVFITKGSPSLTSLTGGIEGCNETTAS